MSTPLLKSLHPPPAPSWHGTCWAWSPRWGQARERKDLFLKSPAPHVAALISISESVA